MADGRRGPNYKEIKKMDFEKLCALQCTQQEICDFFDVDHKTLTAWCEREYGEKYSQIYKEKQTGGKISLRRAQFKLAERNAAMAIFLGRNILGQSDYPDNGFREDVAMRANEQVRTLAEMMNDAEDVPSIEELVSKTDAESQKGRDGE